MRRNRYVKLADVLAEFLENEGLKEGIQKMEVYDAWDKIIGDKLSKYIINKSFVKGKLFCYVSSSVVRNTLFVQRIEIVSRINALLGKNIVETLVLK